MAQGQDIRGTAAMGEDAATTWIMHRNRIGRKSVEGEEDEAVFEDVTKLKLDYSRNSEPRSCRLVFDGATATFVPWTNEPTAASIDMSDETGRR
jgi:hypothetical protein